MTRFCLLLLVLALAALSPAPIRLPGSAPHKAPIYTEEQREQQLSLMKVQGEVGRVLQKEDNYSPGQSPSDLEARDIVGSTAVPRIENQPSGAEVLKEANAGMAAAKQEIRHTVFTALFTFLVLLGIGFGLKKWADKKIPYKPRTAEIILLRQRKERERKAA